MSRTSAAAVKAILLPGRDYDLKQAADLSPFIEYASAIVDDLVECAALSSKVYSATRLELIERWVAAHAFKISDKTFSSRSTEGASASFDGQTAMYLEATLYGQHAITLDATGCLSQQAGGEASEVPPSAGAYWLGRPPSEQTDYEDRR